jgi:hypothetical protein
MDWSKSFYSYKSKKSGLQFKVGLCIKTGDICWWSWPCAPGIWNDLSIFRDKLMTHLLPGEQVETDTGYHGSKPEYVKCPDGLLADPDPAVKLMAARIWSQQETLNERFKNWAILCTPYHHEFSDTKQFLALLSCLPSLLLQQTLCFM